MELKKIEDDIDLNIGAEFESNDTEIDEPTQTPEAVLDTSTNEANAFGNASEPPVTDSESDKETESKLDDSNKTHSLIYLAGGIWTDSNGIAWCREKKDNCISTISMTDVEYQKRDDIQFMVDYGHIKDIISV